MNNYTTFFTCSLFIFTFTAYAADKNENIPLIDNETDISSAIILRANQIPPTAKGRFTGGLLSMIPMTVSTIFAIDSISTNGFKQNGFWSLSQALLCATSTIEGIGNYFSADNKKAKIKIFINTVVKNILEEEKNISEKNATMLQKMIMQEIRNTYAARTKKQILLESIPFFTALTSSFYSLPLNNQDNSIDIVNQANSVSFLFCLASSLFFSLDLFFMARWEKKERVANIDKFENELKDLFIRYTHQSPQV